MFFLTETPSAAKKGQKKATITLYGPRKGKRPIWNKIFENTCFPAVLYYVVISAYF